MLGLLDEVPDTHVPAGWLDDPERLAAGLRGHLDRVADAVRRPRRRRRSPGSGPSGSSPAAAPGSRAGCATCSPSASSPTPAGCARRPGHPCVLVDAEGPTARCCGCCSATGTSTYPRGCAPPSRWCGRAPTLAPADLADHLDPESRLVLCRRLVREGLLRVTDVSDPFRCAAEGDLRGDELAGTASTVRAFLLVENPGPWGVDALLDNRLPTAVKTGLAARARDARVRVNLVRRHHRRPAPRPGSGCSPPTPAPRRRGSRRPPSTEAEQLLDLDLAALGAGRSPGLEPSEETAALRVHPRPPRRVLRRARPPGGRRARRRPPRRGLGDLPHRRRPVRRQRARSSRTASTTAGSTR